MESNRLLATTTLIGLNVTVFIAMVALGVSFTSPTSADLIKFGADNGLLVVFEHQWWRTLTCVFVHVGVLHLVVNMYSLWQLGRIVERLLGTPLFVAIYLLAGLGGSFASILWNSSSVSAGASGAIFGLFGVIVGFAIRARQNLPPQVLTTLRNGIVTTIGLNLAFAIALPFIDNAAHIGGLAVGIFAGIMATASALERKGQGPAWTSQVIVVATVVGLGVLALVRTENSPLSRSAASLSKAAEALKKNDWAEAERLASVAVTTKATPQALLLRSMARSARGDVDAGLSDLDLALSELTDAPQTRALLGQALIMRAQADQATGRHQRAAADLTRAYALEPDPRLLAMRGMSSFRLGDLDAGLGDAQVAKAHLTKDPLLANNLAWALLCTGQHLDEALSLAELAVKHDPSAAALGTRCWVHAARGEEEAATADCIAAVEKGQSPVDRGMLAYLQQRPEEAVRWWQKASNENPLDAPDLAPWLARASDQLDAGAP